MTFLVIAGLITIVGVIAIHKLYQYAQQRAAEEIAARKRVAEQMGWTYREQVDFKTIPDLKRFELFKQGSSRKLRHVLMSPAGDVRGVVFEYSYVVSSGKSSHTVAQTVFYGTSDDLKLPAFSLRPENFFHRVAGALGFQDINFERRPEFSRMFLLRGEDEERIRMAFSDPVLEFFERHPGCCASGMNREVLFWRPGKKLDPHEFEAFIEEGYELAGRLIASHSGVRPQMG